MGWQRRRSRSSANVPRHSNAPGEYYRLQEVSFASGMDEMLAEKALFRVTGMRPFPGPTPFRKEAQYGNLLLTSYEAGAVRRVDLSIPGSEPRGAIDADLYVGGKMVRVIVTHLGLQLRERWYQIKPLAEELSRWRSDFVILLGDFNRWFPSSLFLWRLITWFGGTGYAGATFPAHFSLLALDRILIRPRSSLLRMGVVRTPQARRASDHLPVKALIWGWLTVWENTEKGSEEYRESCISWCLGDFYYGIPRSRA